MELALFIIGFGTAFVSFLLFLDSHYKAMTVSLAIAVLCAVVSYIYHIEPYTLESENSFISSKYGEQVFNKPVTITEIVFTKRLPLSIIHKTKVVIDCHCGDTK